MGRRNGKRMERRYRIELDGKGRVVCKDEYGRSVPLGRCIRLGIGENEQQVKVAIRKSCELGADFEKDIKKRIMEKGQTLWKVTDDETEEWEDASYFRTKSLVSKKKRRAKV